MRLPTILTLTVFSLAGCNEGVGEYRSGGCPRLQDYSVQERQAAAREIRGNPDGALAKMVRDYGKLRKACRV